MARPKDVGTSEESLFVNTALAKVPGIEAERLPEGGPDDKGDVRLRFTTGAEVIVESKRRANLTIHRAVRKAQDKAGSAPAAVWWTRLVKKDGAKRASPVPGGARTVVVVEADVFLDLMRIVQSGWNLAADAELCQHELVQRLHDDLDFFHGRDL